MKGALKDAEAREYLGVTERVLKWIKTVETRAEACALALMQALEGK